MQPTQYTLAVTLPDDETLQSFYGARESTAVQFIEQFLAPGQPQLPVYLFGASGSGKSHLLYAACVQAQELGLTSQLLALDDFRQYSPRLFDGLEQLDLVCLDNIQAIAGDSHWQVALFDLYNRMVEQGKRLMIVADEAPLQLGITLPDLVSRLQACTIFQLRLLSDDDKQKLLQQKARLRGIELPDEVARFLLNRQQRDIRALVAILDKLDKASIVHQRKLTIPFVKDVLAQTGG
ncbi:MAG: DnaA inactivator Hda [Gammaproteobacteria bacterium]|jgi:DnaA-homolog protein|nr:DnaA inactivator Hda [Gammaproteobacteria bacterium]MBU2179190.1 DnaA inactivator Hda [Gammaproteobacteria bacterium]MBU2278208.1 DnaA inactivator Hda [Gammaproteobacteria bacterium]MBU2427607.1 DnaA inactivator Hda [Gammaproteobacteria bacterium]